MTTPVVDLVDPAQPQTIVLQTTPVEQIPGHIEANGRCRTCDRPVYHLPFKPTQGGERTRPEWGCQCDEPEQWPTIKGENECKGQTLAICGAGPSLSSAKRVVARADQVWGCNRAAHFLNRYGWRCTHAFGIDAGEGMWRDCWAEIPEAEEGFVLATTVDPRLTSHLRDDGQPLRFFHSVRGGLPEEFDLYRIFWPSGTAIVGQGLNSVNRAIELALFMGFDRIDVCGADNALGSGRKMYAQGDRVVEAEECILGGTIDGRYWETRPDMLLSAVDLARAKRRHGDRIRFVGDTLPKVLARKPDAFLDRCIKWAYADERA